MLGEFTGFLQLVSCVFFCVATCVWLKILRHVNKSMYEIRYENMKLEITVGSLETRVRMLTQLAGVNHHIEEVRETLASLHAKE
jgi:hypothetical protein